MPLQNRVSVTGDIIETPERGLMMGNRGRIHDPISKKLLKKRWALKAWIICVTEFKDRHRSVMGHSYTELFFLDDVTALAAGHRPCFECRRQAAKSYQMAWQSAKQLNAPPKVGIMDPQLHAERVINGKKRKHLLPTASLPDGVVIELDEKFFALHNGHLFEWCFSGYQRSSITVSQLPEEVTCLTPPSSIAALNAGFEPIWHPSVRGA